MVFVYCGAFPFHIQRLESPSSCYARALGAIIACRENNRRWLVPELRRGFVPLPNEYGELLVGAHKQLCSRLGTPSKTPALCLLCGEYVCFQSMCCLTRLEVNGREKMIGGCMGHVRK